MKPLSDAMVDALEAYTQYLPGHPAYVIRPKLTIATRQFAARSATVEALAARGMIRPSGWADFWRLTAKGRHELESRGFILLVSSCEKEQADA